MVSRRRQRRGHPAARSALSRNRAAIVEAYPFAPAQKIIDVGGGVGSLMISLLSANPGTTGVICDLPSVVEGARRLIDEAGLAERCECIAGDFFTTVPASGDAYLLVSILHDWDDDRCLTILKNCRRAMPNDARLLIVEMVIPAGTGTSFVKLFDTTMLVLTGGRERTQDEFEQLLGASGFRLNRAMPTASTVQAASASAQTSSSAMDWPAARAFLNASSPRPARHAAVTFPAQSTCQRCGKPVLTARSMPGAPQLCVKMARSNPPRSCRLCSVDWG
jgi:hypothetical protein